MAAAFLRLVAQESPHGHRIGNLERLPDEFSCVAEEKVKKGRADLTFRDETGRWHVIVENKLYSGYGDDRSAATSSR